jgi:hypothetical protein
MARFPRIFRSMLVLVGTAAIIAGCGGAAVESPADVTPTPDTSASGATVAGTTNPVTSSTLAGGAAAVDPTTGAPIAGATGATATIPKLAGDDVSGSLSGGVTKDIFAPAAVDSSTADVSAGVTDTTATSTATNPPEITPPTTTAAAQLIGATIYVNGKTYTVKTNGTFPVGAPIFRLVSVDAGSIEISLLAGEFTGDHSDGLFLDKGDLKSLVDASADITYKVKFLRALADTSGQGF